MKLLDNVQRRWTKSIDGFENLPYSQRLKDLGLFSVEGRLLRINVIKYWKIFPIKYGLWPMNTIVFARSGITRGHRFKIAHEIFSMDCRRRKSTMRVASNWNSLPDDVVSLETMGSFKRE